MRKLLTILLIAFLSLTILTATAIAGAPTPKTPTKVLGGAVKGMYCSDPVPWVNGGYRVFVWNLATPFRSVVFDQNGYKMNTPVSYRLQETGETGSQSLINATYLLFGVSPLTQLVTADTDYHMTSTAGNATETSIINRAPAGCGTSGCHPTPPAHAIANSSTDGKTSKCNSCHNLADKIHPKHYGRVANDATGCMKCHPNGCLTGVHNGVKNCVDCHGTLLNSTQGTFKIEAQAGYPKCASCHDAQHAENTGKYFKDSYGHGGVWCIACHESTHVDAAQPFGYNNCAGCHTTKPYDRNMGPNCGQCHVSSVSPHLVKK